MVEGARVIIAWASLHDQTYWDRHPDLIRRLHGTDPSDDKLPLCLTFLFREAPKNHLAAWQSKLAGPEPNRAPDLEMYGDGTFDTDFFDRMPGVEHVGYYDDEGDPPAQPPGWWLKVWLSDADWAAAR